MQEINRRNVRLWSFLGQRGTVCGEALPEICEKNGNCYVLTADLGHLSGLDRFQSMYPDRYINVGIAEQNMIGVAAGLAFEGNTVFATTYATFVTMRCYEQIRHNLGYQNANVKLLGSTSGIGMGMSGNTHYSYEDIAIMRAIPNMMVVSPADATEAYLTIHAAMNSKKPMYIRLSGGLNTPIIYKEPYDFQLGKAVVLKEGCDIAIIGTGNMVRDALLVAEKLEEDNLSVAVVDMHTIKPLDKEILKQFSNVKLCVSMEEHSISGGMGSAIAEYYVTQERHPRQLFLGLPDRFLHPAEYEFMREDIGLTPDTMYAKIKKVFQSI